MECDEIGAEISMALINFHVHLLIRSAKIVQSVKRLAMGCTAGVRFLAEAAIFLLLAMSRLA